MTNLSYLGEWQCTDPGPPRKRRLGAGASITSQLIRPTDVDGWNVVIIADQSKLNDLFSKTLNLRGNNCSRRTLSFLPAGPLAPPSLMSGFTYSTVASYTWRMLQPSCLRLRTESSSVTVDFLPFIWYRQNLEVSVQKVGKCITWSPV